MELGWFESLIFGFISGLTRFLPVSAQAHEALMQKLYGANLDPLLGLLIHGGTLLALVMGLRQHISLLLRERSLMKIPPRRRKRQPDVNRVLELRLIRTAATVLLVVYLIFVFLPARHMDLSLTALFLILNGILLYIPGHIPNGNKDERSMSALDALLMGLAGGASAIPGISAVGSIASVAIGRGADQENALRWAMLLSIPALAAACAGDVYGIVSGGTVLSFPMILQCLLAAVSAYVGATVGISIVRFLAVRAGFSGFAYYCWGAALFSFLMYLTI